MAGKICMRDHITMIFSDKSTDGINPQSGSVYILIVLFLFVQSSSVWSQSVRSKINEGNSQYQEEKYEEALNNYQDALLDDPKNNVAIFNQGDALYKLEKYDKAIEAYQKIIGGKDLLIDGKAHYNIGNAYFKQDKLKESIESYIRALDLNPDDQDAKYNLELARAKLKEMADKQQQQNGQQQQGGQQQGEQQQGEDGQNKEGQEQQQAQQEQPKNEESEKEEQKSQALKKSEDEMTKEDAERILDALKNDEQDTQKLRMPAHSEMRNVDKDW